MLKLNMVIISMILLSMFMKPNKVWWVMSSTMMFSSMLLMCMMENIHNITSTYSMLDTMSISLISLSYLITSLMLMASYKILIMKKMPLHFLVASLILLMTLINAFSSKNLFIFYIWFEASLIPTMFIIINWGYQPERVQASMYMMIYTVVASTPMFLMFTLMYMSPESSLMLLQTSMDMPSTFNILLISGFLVKLPMFLSHLWLPKAHVEAPIAGSMILAAILLKLGGYGVCRMISMSPLKIMNLSSILMSISMVGAIMTSLICIRQPDLKSLIAYSSVGHMGLMITGTLSMSSWGLSGTLMMMIAHGLCSSSMFILANINYELYHTRSMFLMKGMMSIIPSMSMWWFMFSAINMAAPPTINLLSEIMLITSTMSFSIMFIIPLSILTFMTGVYSLNMYSNINHGNTSNFMNSTLHSNSVHHTLLMSHITPIILLIMTSEMISMW